MLKPLQLLDWVIFAFLFGIAIYFVQDAITIYILKRSSLSQSFQPITKLPTFVICWASHYTYKYDVHYYFVYDYKHILKMDEFTYINDTDETVYVEQVRYECFKISSYTSTALKPGASKVIHVKFNENLDSVYLPFAMNIIVTDEVNSYGTFLFKWHNGKPLMTMIEPGDEIHFGLTQESYKYLDENQQCAHSSFEEQWKPYILSANFSECPIKCFPFRFPFEDLPLCGFSSDNSTERICAWYVHWDAYYDFIDLGIFKRPCDILQYTGQHLIRGSQNPHQTTIVYNFLSPELTIAYEEYLTFNPISLLAAIGGTLGIYVGFSVSGLVSKTFQLIGDEKKRKKDINEDLEKNSSKKQ